jgi:3'-phosphoadenosine 5'-phosphosulfate sulfotransferase (PAPS reductase)/FAD synthetase
MSNAYKLAITTISTVAQQADRAILFYSGGKDSIALLDMMAPNFKEIHICFMYFVKGLRHCDKYLEFSQKRYNNIKIVQVPHFRLTSIRREGLFCNPEPTIKILSLSDIDKHIRSETGIEWSFYGMKKSDSLNRRLMLKSYGELPIQATTKKVYPLADFKDGDVIRYIQKSKLPMPIKYGNKRSNAVGFDIDCMLWMRENEPGDLEKVYQRFPKSRQILFEYDYHEQNKTSKI